MFYEIEYISVVENKRTPYIYIFQNLILSWKLKYDSQLYDIIECYILMHIWYGWMFCGCERLLQSYAYAAGAASVDKIECNMRLVCFL